MKTVFLIFAIAACAVYAVPVIEEPAPNPEEGVVVDLDKLAATLAAEFNDDAFLEEEAKKFDMDKLMGVNSQLIAGGKWMKNIPWGVIIDMVVEGIKKATE